MRKLILASHGEFSKGLQNSLQMIIGDLAKDVTTYSLYPGENAEDFKEELEQEIKEHSETEYVILTDVYGGSVCSSLISLTVYDNVFLFTGMNFNMAVELLTGFTEPLTKENISELLEEVKLGIHQVIIESNEMEDF